VDPREIELRRAIVADPDSDELRLVYADYWEESGDPDRAELIRLQIETARDEELYSFGLGARERWLVDRHGDRWRSAHGASDGHFARGLIRAVPAELLIARGELARELPVEHIWITEPAPEIAGAPWLAAIRSMAIRGVSDPARIGRAVAAPGPRLRALATIGCSREGALAAVAAAPPGLDQLRLVDRTGDAGGDALLAAICRRSFAPGLRELSLWWTGTAGALRALAPASLGSLEKLDLGSMGDVGEPIDAAALSGLCAAAPELGSINIRSTGLGERAIAAVAGLGSLREIALLDRGLGPASLAPLAARVPGLRALSLTGGLGPGGATFLFEAGAPELRVLSLADAEIAAIDVAALLDEGACPALESLDLGYNPIGPDAACALLTSQLVGQLRSLALDDSDLDDDAARAIRRAARPSAVTCLLLSHNPLGDDGLGALLDAGLLDRVIDLDLDDTLVSDAGVLRLLHEAPSLARVGLHGTAVSSRARDALRERLLVPD
jgi:uncharacterized protein (TIGR02996 family)